MASPTFTNPHLGTDAQAGWAMGFTWGFLGPAFSSPPPLLIAPELVDAFNEGVLAGQQAAIDGIPIEPACLSLAQDVPSGPETFMQGFHVFESLSLIRAARHFAHFTIEGLVGVFLLMIPSPPELDPIQEFNRVGANVRDRLTELGLTGKSLFIGGGIDETIEGCELLFTRVFTRLDDVRKAVLRMERTQSVIAQWDTQAPISGGGFVVIESGAG